MSEIRSFGAMNNTEKLDFFQKCQELLVKNQPNSPYILRSRRPANKSYFLDIMLKYKGFAFRTESMAMLFNKHYYSSKKEIHENYRDNLYLPPSSEPNCYCVDFITSDLNKKIIKEIEPIFPVGNIQYICFLRAQKLSVFDWERFRTSVLDNYA